MAEKEQVIQALKATLISVKGALTIKQCNRDYRELQGEWIPYKKLGYSSLEKLFQDVPGFKITEINGEWVVDAIASQETQHIASMVARQKPAKKHSLKLNYANRFPKKQGSWRKPAPTTNYSSNYNNQYSNQYYRVKSNTPFNNNSFNYKYNKHTQHNRSNGSVSSSQSIKTVDVQGKSALNNYKGSVEVRDKSVLNGSKGHNTSQVLRETSSLLSESKHSIKSEKETEGKRNGRTSASQRLSILRDRLNTVDLIPLQLPAHTDYSQSDVLVKNTVPGNALEPPPDSTSSVAKLEWTCRKLGLPEPVYKVHDQPVRGPVGHLCSVKVGNTYTASSYPDSAPTEELSREVAAVKMLAVIESSEAPGLTTSGEERALAGLSELVAAHEAGVWASMVPHLYREKHGENLPNNWLQLLENCPHIIKDRVVNGLLVLLPNNEEIKSPLPMNDAIDSDLPPLKFPQDNSWNVCVTLANSTLEVWLIIIGPQYSDEGYTLCADMKAYYAHSGTTVDKAMLIQNAWYAVNMDSGDWVRAKVLEIEDETATVFLGDFGDEVMVHIKKIKILEPQFRKLPAQAILSRLEGAEELAASEAGVAQTRSRLTNETLVAVPGPRHDPFDPAVAVVLYDTSTKRDINLNQELVEKFCKSGVFELTEKPCEVEVGCVTDEGRVWVSRVGGADTVRAALALLTSGPYRRPLPAAPHAPPAHTKALYIVRTLDGDWVRCLIISGLDGEGTVRTQLVDSGLVLRAPLSSLVPLSSFSPALDAYPPQAQAVRLGAAERVAGAMVARLRELLLGECVLCRTLPGAAPHVELFVRLPTLNILASVNNSILMEYDYIHSAKPEEEKENDMSYHLEALHKKKERLFRTMSASADERGAAPERRSALPPPVLPAPAQCYDVYVAMAANPWNFVVQPNCTRNVLQTMMATLQVECPKIPESEAPIKPASGELYVAYYDKDNSWYRVTVAGEVSTEMVSVYFCDYGDLALFASAALRRVPATAPLARSLPPQAIKAKLYDVKPLHQDWTVEDCIRFQELCVEQQFVGICMDVGKDPLNPSEPLLTLNLIDTSTDEDVYINKLLVAEGRARLASAS
ncbi:tudor domain-containing protein 7 [Maniola jurtina]|uniref:tudor domain-containing protein 7 n=1 Tax=Maniola jurtina TaxID=191418 RepID=UPI001E689709|nr:tudor domain-containing protein 7 [Maniola jurtina]XP_045772825.1 tudor domain-containing protein 7 [Maniola jurtina]XP_045772834.1 tudor domain-containing protein 7 [Maniola jurtina]